MQHIHKLLTLFLILSLSLCMGCSLNTVGRVGNTLLEAASDVNIFTDAEELQFGQAFVPEGAVVFFETLRAMRGREPSSLEEFLSTHPVPSERVLNVRKQISSLPPKSGLRTDSSRFRQIKRRIQ